MIFEGFDPGFVGQLALAAAVAIGVLYLLRLRRRRVTVAHAALWRTMMKRRRARSWLRMLQRLLSLLLQLAVVGLLALGLGRAIVEDGDLDRLGDGCRTPEDVQAEPIEDAYTVIAVDVSASMGATDVPGGRLSQAVDAARRVVLDRAEGEKMLLATLDRRLRPLTPFTADTELLMEQLAERTRVRDSRVDLAQAWPSLTSLLAGRAKPRLVLITDGGLDLPPTWDWAEAAEGWRIERILVGDAQAAKANFRLDGLEVRPYLDDPLTYELYVSATNPLDRPVEATLTLYAEPDARTADAFLNDGQVVSSLPLSLPAAKGPSGGVLKTFIPQVDFLGSRLMARLTVPEEAGVVDPLPADNLAFAVVPPRRTLRVQLVTEGNLFLEAALFVREHVEYEWVKPAEFAGPSGWDLTILDQFTPDTLKPGRYLIVDPPSSVPVRWTETAGLPDLVKKAKDHPVLWKIALADLNVASVKVLEPGANDRVLAETAEGQPAMVLHEASNGTSALVWGFDLAQSDLPLRYAFPLLLVNTLNYFYAEVSALRPGRRAGEDWAVELNPTAPTTDGPSSERSPSDEPELATMTTPSGARKVVPVSEGRALVLGDETGIWTVEAEGLGEEGPLDVAANLLAPTESSLARDSLDSVEAWAPSERVADDAPDAPDLPAPLWQLGLLLALGILVLEWYTWHRRITV